VFRAGFKIPKHVSSPLEVGGAAYGFDDDGSVGSMSSIGTMGSRPHTTAVGGRKGGRYGSPKKMQGSASGPIESQAHEHALDGGVLPPVRQGTSPGGFRK
jgi:hypothetical protein